MESLYIMMLCIASLISGQQSKIEVQHTEPEAINWVTWEEAVELNKTAPRKIFVDMYTEWCGWCKKMDKSTFVDPAVVKYISENFYAVKFNAEQKEDIEYSGNVFKYVKSGRRGIHQLAYALLNGKASYPSFVYLDETFARIMISPGFKKPADILPELAFAHDEKYKDISWEEYKAAQDNTGGKLNGRKPKAAQADSKKIETLPRFPGCEDSPNKESCAKKKMLEFIDSKVVYPAAAQEQNLEAMPIVEFYVESDGKITNIKVLRDGENGFGEAATKAVEAMNQMKHKWIPATSNGENVRAKYLVPVKFRLKSPRK